MYFFRHHIKVLVSLVILGLSLITYQKYLIQPKGINILSSQDLSDQLDKNGDANESPYNVAYQNIPIQNTNVLGASTQNQTKGSKILILMYHYIKEYSDKNDMTGISLSVSPKNFDRQMNELLGAGFTPVSMNQIKSSIESGKPLPSNPMLISFDDGYKDQYTQAFPILQKYNIKATFGIITGFVGNEGYMAWSDIKEMKLDGQEIVSHSVSHPHLAKISIQNIETELKNSKQTLDTILSQDTKALIYPYGSYNNNVIKIAKSTGYTIARTTAPGNVISTSNQMSLPTLYVKNDTKFSNSSYKIIDKTQPQGSLECPEFTNSPHIDVKIIAKDNITTFENLKYKLSKSSDLQALPYLPIINQIKTDINITDAPQTLYGQVADEFGNQSSIFSCIITLNNENNIKDIKTTIGNDNAQIYMNVINSQHIKVNYGIDEHYGYSSNNDLKVDGHTYKAQITNLLPCTTYHFQIETINQDIVHKSADNIFTTKNCIGSSNINLSTQSKITSVDGGTIKLQNNSNIVSFEIAKNSIDQTLQFELKNLETANLLSTVSIPSNLKPIGDSLYEIKALSDPTHEIHNFTKPIKVSFKYSLQDIAPTLSNDSLSIYRWDDGKWTQLSNCSNTQNSTITCNTNNFSIFGLFGKDIQKLVPIPIHSNELVGIGALTSEVILISTFGMINILYLKRRKKLNKKH